MDGFIKGQAAVDRVGGWYQLPALEALCAAKHAATVMPVRSVRIDSPIVPGGNWRVVLLAPGSQGGAELEVYPTHSGLSALDIAGELVKGRQWPPAEQARG